jgi:hypothetical protein
MRHAFAKALVTFAFAVAATNSIAGEQSYSGLETRKIKALSAQRQEDLLAGRGAGFALAAELNGLPGPRHVLDLAGELELSDEARVEIQEIFAKMNAEARQLGVELVTAESRLDALFTEGSATHSAVSMATLEIAKIEARLRATHLNAHLETRPILSQHQTMLYARARGYNNQNQHGQHSTGH